MGSCQFKVIQKGLPEHTDLVKSTFAALVYEKGPVNCQFQYYDQTCPLILPSLLDSIVYAQEPKSRNILFVQAANGQMILLVSFCTSASAGVYTHSIHILYIPLSLTHM